MRKRIVGAIVIMLLLAGCGQKAEMPQATPKATETPQAAVTEAPRETEVPKRTAAPQATATPMTTEAPKATGIPEADGTAAPKGTEAPKGTAVPQATPTPVTTEAPKATAVPDAVVTEVPKATEVPQKTETSGTTEGSQENNDYSSTPTVTEAPKPTEAPREEIPTPVVTEAPKPTEEPAATEAPKPTEEPAATKAPEVCQHDMQEYIFREPDCKVGEGYACDRCSKCGYTENHHYIPYEHDFEEVMGFPGDCMTTPSYTLTCKNCGWVEKRDGDSVNMDNHREMYEGTYTDLDLTTLETVTYYIRECRDCNTVFEEYEVGREPAIPEEPVIP